MRLLILELLKLYRYLIAFYKSRYMQLHIIKKYAAWSARFYGHPHYKTTLNAAGVRRVEWGPTSTNGTGAPWTPRAPQEAPGSGN